MAANPARGEVDIVVNRLNGGGVASDRTYTLKLTMKGSIAVETALKRRFRDVTVAALGGEHVAIQAVVFASLLKYHGDEIKTLEDAGELIDDSGGVDAFFAHALGVLDAGDAPDLTGGSQPDARPQEAQAGTSSDSSSMPDAPA